MTVRLPLYSQLKETITADIASGMLAPGDSLPSHRDLIKHYGMSHMTVRRAIDELVNEGVLYTIPGKGVYVAEQKREAESGALISFTEDIARRGMKASSQLLEARMVTASQLLTAAMGIEFGAPVVYLRRLRMADNVPMAIQTTYVPHRLAPGLLAYDLSHESLFTILKSRYNLKLADSSVAVEALLATDDEAELLTLMPPAALLVTEQTTYLNTGEAIEFTRSAYRGDQYRRRL